MRRIRRSALESRPDVKPQARPILRSQGAESYARGLPGSRK
jgi:hypothetical protein